MKNTYLFGLGLLILLPLLLFFQLRQIYNKGELYEVKGLYERMELKKHRIYKMKLFLEEFEDAFTLDKPIYPAWDKHFFQRDIKKGDSVKMLIPQKNIALLQNGQEDIVYITQMSAGKSNKLYFRLEEHNLYRQMDFIKFYVFWGIGAIVFLYQMFFNKSKES